MSDEEINKKFPFLWDKLVPDSGKAPTKIGEMVRCVGKLEYELYNNGNGNAGSGSHYMNLWRKLNTFVKKNSNSKDLLHSINLIVPLKSVTKGGYGIPRPIIDAYLMIKEWLINFIENGESETPKRREIAPISDLKARVKDLL